MLTLLRQCGVSASRYHGCSVSLLKNQRRSVWHAGFETAKEAKELVAAIDKLLLSQQTATPSAFAKTKQSLQSLLHEYEELTGELFDENRSSK